MIFPNENSWKVWGITHEAHKFFILRWNEIFAEETFDSWQVRFANVKSTLNEILNAIDVAEQVQKSHKSILTLIEEAIFCTRNDIVIRESFPFVRDYLKRLKNEYKQSVENSNKKNNERTQETLRNLTRVIIGHMEKYREKLFSRIRILIANPPDEYKIDLDGLIMSLGIELKSMGYSIPYLREAFDIFTTPTLNDFPARFNRFQSQYNGDIKNYECRDGSPGCDISEIFVGAASRRDCRGETPLSRQAPWLLRSG